MLTRYPMLAWNSSTHRKRAPWRPYVDGREWTAPRSMGGMFVVPISGLNSEYFFQFLGPRVKAAVAPATIVGLGIHILDEGTKIETGCLGQSRAALIRLKLLRGSILAGMPKKLMRYLVPYNERPAVGRSRLHQPRVNTDFCHGALKSDGRRAHRSARIHDNLAGEREIVRYDDLLSDAVQLGLGYLA